MAMTQISENRITPPSASDLLLSMVATINLAIRGNTNLTEQQKAILRKSRDHLVAEYQRGSSESAITGLFFLTADRLLNGGQLSL